ncbi:MAG: L,D-transpeptidase [Hyphomicrobium sp.]
MSSAKSYFAFAGPMAVAMVVIGSTLMSAQPAAAQGYPEWGYDDAPLWRQRPRTPLRTEPLDTEPLDDETEVDRDEDRNWRRTRDPRLYDRRYPVRRFDAPGNGDPDDVEEVWRDAPPRVRPEPRRPFRSYDDGDEQWPAEQPDARAVGVNGGARPFIQPVAPPIVAFGASYAPGSVVIDSNARRLYFVRGHMSAFAYPIGVGREGFSWTGTEKVSRVADWPDWYPPAEMRKRKPELPERMLGGLNNPLGAKAIYLGNTLYRIHGTSDPKSIGRAESSGCFRMHNAHVLHLASLVSAGTEVSVVRSLGRAPVRVGTAKSVAPLPKPALAAPTLKPRIVQRQPLAPRMITRAPYPPRVRWSADPDRRLYDERDYDLR